MTWVRRALLTLFLSLVILVGATNLPLSRQALTIIDYAKTPEVIALGDNDTLAQSFVIPAGRYSGVRLYAHSPEKISSRLNVTLKDANGAILATGRSGAPVYESEDRLVSFAVPWRWVSFIQNTRVVLETEVIGEQHVPLRVSDPAARDVYTAGAIQQSGQGMTQDLALELTQPVPLAHGAQQGVIAAIVFLLGLTLIWRIPQERNRWWATVVLFAVITPLVLLGYWYSTGDLGVADWDYYFSLHHYYREIIVTHHQLPFWNPYTCGGTAGLGDPEFPVFTPTFFLELLFGVRTGIPLAIFLATFGGAAGMLALSRRLRLSLPAAIAAALIAFFGTVNLLEITEGHVNVFAASWIPWIFWAWLGAYRNLNFKTAFVAGAFLAATFLQGGIYLLMYTALAFIVLPFLVSKPWQAIRTTIFAGLWALGLASFKLLPVLRWLGQFPDDAYAGSAYTLPWLGEILFGRHLHGSYLIFEQMTGWHEYGAYVGYLALFLAIIGLSYFWKHRLVRGLLVAVILAGGISAVGPSLVPLFDQLWFFPRSSVSRFIFFAIIPFALLAAFGLERLRSHSRSAQFVAWLFIGLLAIDLFSLTYPLSEQAFVLPAVLSPPEKISEPIAFTPDRYDAPLFGDRFTRSFVAAEAGYGTLIYCSVLGPEPRVRTIYDEGANAPVFVVAPGATWEVTHWSPNEVSVAVTTPTETKVAVNTNFVKGWNVSVGEITQVDGRLAALVPAGNHQLTFSYHAPGVKLGVGLTIATLLLAGLHLNRKKSRS